MIRRSSRPPGDGRVTATRRPRPPPPPCRRPCPPALPPRQAHAAALCAIAALAEPCSPESQDRIMHFLMMIQDAQITSSVAAPPPGHRMTLAARRRLPALGGTAGTGHRRRGTGGNGLWAGAHGSSWLAPPTSPLLARPGAAHLPPRRAAAAAPRGSPAWLCPAHQMHGPPPSPSAAGHPSPAARPATLPWWCPAFQKSRPAAPPPGCASLDRALCPGPRLPLPPPPHASPPGDGVGAERRRRHRRHSGPTSSARATRTASRAQELTRLRADILRVEDLATSVHRRTFDFIRCQMPAQQPPDQQYIIQTGTEVVQHFAWMSLGLAKAARGAGRLELLAGLRQAAEASAFMAAALGQDLEQYVMSGGNRFPSGPPPSRRSRSRSRSPFVWGEARLRGPQRAK